MFQAIACLTCQNSKQLMGITWAATLLCEAACLWVAGMCILSISHDIAFPWCGACMPGADQYAAQEVGDSKFRLCGEILK